MQCPPESFNDVRDSLEARFGVADSVGLEWLPQTSIPVDEDQARVALKMIETLEDSDDVQSVSANFEISDEILEKLSA